jgi:hypothetical protein
MPKVEPSTGRPPPTWQTTRAWTLARAQVARLTARTRMTGLGIGVLGCAALLGLVSLIAYAAMTLVQVLVPWLAIVVVAKVVPLNKSAPSTNIANAGQRRS